jgi:hypothetical protein
MLVSERFFLGYNFFLGYKIDEAEFLCQPDLSSSMVFAIETKSDAQQVLFFCLF